MVEGRKFAKGIGREVCINFRQTPLPSRDIMVSEHACILFASSECWCQISPQLLLITDVSKHWVCILKSTSLPAC